MTTPPESNDDPTAMDPDGSCDGSASPADKRKMDKRQQFTIKQRMDMYAFCVLEMEINGDKVSIKKQQNAVQKVLKNRLKETIQQYDPKGHSQETTNGQALQQQDDHERQQTSQPQNEQQTSHTHQGPGQEQQQQQHQAQPQQQLMVQHQHTQNTISGQQNHWQIQQQHQQQQQQQSDYNHNNQPPNGNDIESQSQGGLQKTHLVSREKCPSSNINTQDDWDPYKTLSEMKMDLEYKSYSDFQRVSPLTTQMLRAVQHRFAKYYPKCTPPSRTTIKHVFEKCVNHGTVENIKTRRKATKIPQGNEITNLLVNEPQLSLRQMARRLNVSTGTVSRRCKALGLIPDSVTTKHQQLAIAKRQKQIKKMECDQKNGLINVSPGPSTSRVPNSRAKT